MAVSVQDQIDAAKASARAKSIADAAATDADRLDAANQSALLNTLVTLKGSVVVVAPDGNSVDQYAAVGSPPTLSVVNVPFAGTVPVPAPTPDQPR